ncbi:MAG: undecaprenyl diphosphate synthase family protein, partial [Clostridia bacterium]
MGNRLTHLAIIMDGNGRWAQNRGLSRFVGHKEGLNTVKKVASWCIKYEIN